MSPYVVLPFKDWMLGSSGNENMRKRRITKRKRLILRARFSNWKIIGRPKLQMWLCQCKCGTVRRVRGNALLAGTTRSCGCRNFKHRHCRRESGVRKISPTYRSWQSMLTRCYNKNRNDYHFYGGRGIRVCKRWRHSFVNFLGDMGPRSLGTTLDRYPDRNGNYRPNNCRWATPTQQANNRKKRKRRI